ncbi:menaquinone biosynthetic enzyme MqnA/MqnD family protein [Streptomyces sp. JNUCC 64]
MSAVHSARRPRPGSPRPPAAPLRLGDLSYLNCVPPRWGLARGGAHGIAADVSGPPERIAAELLAGRLDAGPVSLVRYLRHTDVWEPLPGGVAIGGDGPVRSCHLVSRVPLEDLDAAGVALSEASRTTNLLARVLLEDALGVRPRYHRAPQDLPGMLARADAAVLIGDEALRVGAAPPPGVRVHDLGALWRQWTGLPMVFAVWVVRRTVARARPERVRATATALREAVALARAHPSAVAAAGAEESARGPGGRLSERTLLDYYRALDHCLGPRQLTAVRVFARHAAAHGEVPGRALTLVPGGRP